jgi:hypothetical protein
MVTINNLEVRFDVEGGDDDASFATLFEKYIRQWSRKQEEARDREQRSARDRALGDRYGDE